MVFIGIKQTKTDAVFKHRVLWCDISEKLRQFEGLQEGTTITSLKRDVFLTRFSEIMYPRAYCFLCHYAIDQYAVATNKSESMCGYCPLMRPYTRNYSAPVEEECLGGLYSEAERAVKEYDFSRASKTALKIAFLPVIN